MSVKFVERSRDIGEFHAVPPTIDAQCLVCFSPVWTVELMRITLDVVESEVDLVSIARRSRAHYRTWPCEHTSDDAAAEGLLWHWMYRVPEVDDAALGRS